MNSLYPKTLLVAVLIMTGLVKSDEPGFSQTIFDQWRAEWQITDFSKTSIDYADIMSGGPPKDGIPSIDNPLFHPLASERKLGSHEPVIGVMINGDARAYPLRILMWHEIVNDMVGGVPVAVTYCPLCNTSIVFERRIGGKVLRGDPAARRDYGRNPYANYDSAAIPMLYRGDMPEGINPMARVISVSSKGKKYAVALELLRKRGKLKIGDISLSWQTGQNSALDSSRIKQGRDVGNVVAQREINGKLQDVAYEVTFAFAFHAFHPDWPIEIGK